MGMSCKNPKKNSKRQPVKLRFSIQKKAMAQKKRMKKLAKTVGAVKKSRRRDPGIPNSFPLKVQLLQEVAKSKQEEQEDKLKRRMALREARLAAAAAAKAVPGTDLSGGVIPGLRELVVQRHKGGDPTQEDFDFGAMSEAVSAAPKVKPQTTMGGSLEAIAAAAQRSGAQFNEAANDGDEANAKAASSQARGRSFKEELDKILIQADVVLKVLDARDPNGCRHPPTERTILEGGKRIIFVLNKIDLVPTEVARAWLKYLRRVAPTVAFKSLIAGSTGAGKRAKLSKDDALGASRTQMESKAQVLGATTLLNLLKNYSRIEGTGTKTTKGPLSVGIVGYPNVGKSSIINSLTRNAAAARVGGEAGVTRHLQEIHLDKRIKLIDSPGVVFTGDETSDPSNILRNAVKITNVKEPALVVKAIVERTPADVLMKLFKVPAFLTPEMFIGHVARSRGKLSKGGRPDNDAAARLIVGEWTSGKLRHYCMPPTAQEEAPDEDKAVLTSFAKEFDIEALWKENDADVEGVAGDSLMTNSGETVVQMSSEVPQNKTPVNSLPTGILVTGINPSPMETRADTQDNDTSIKRKRRRALLVEETEKKEERAKKQGASSVPKKKIKRKASDLDTSPDF